MLALSMLKSQGRLPEGPRRAAKPLHELLGDIVLDGHDGGRNRCAVVELASRFRGHLAVWLLASLCRIK
jgi:hypothetical protein